MVKATCTSLMFKFNPDEWPCHFVVLPRVKETVISKDGTQTMMVVNIRHHCQYGGPKSRNEIVPKVKIILGR